MEVAAKTSLVLTWENVSGWTKPTRKTESKQILDNVSGTARSGVLTAIVSPSGAGKTTLLAILSKRYKGIACGTIRLNGLELSQQEMSRICGYVCQKEHNFEDLTVYEHMKFMARLKMDRNTTEMDRHQNIFNIVQSLSFPHRLHSTIRSLSGGQKKRLTLAVQLLTEPKILFCDEPTTGLDSYSAERVVRLLRSLANGGKMVICSIHQPASGIFENFDDATLLASGGKMAYHGPVESINSYFSALGRACPENYNLCEYIVSQVTVKHSTQNDVAVQEKHIQTAVQFFQKSDIHRDLKKDIRESSFMPQKIVRDAFDNRKWKKNSVPFCTELGWLFWRSFVLFRHQYRASLLPFAAYLMVFSIISIPYYGIIKPNQEGVQNMIGFLNIFITQIMYSALSSVVNILPEEMPVFIQETTDSVYSPSAFYISKACFMTANLSIQEIIFMSFALTITGLTKNLSDYVTAAVPTLLLTFTSIGYGFFLSSAFRSVDTYSLFSVPFEICSILLTGLSLKLDSLPWYSAWLKYLSFPYYAYESLNIIEWAKFSHIYCERKSLDECHLTGDAVLSFLGFSRQHLPTDFIGLICCMFTWHTLAFIALIYKIRLFAAY